MREPARVALDDVSDHLGEVLRRADRLLAEWSAFGDRVRDEVEREARAIGQVVATSVDGAVRSAAERALVEQLEQRLSTLTAELARLEQRSRAASRALAEEKSAQRRIAWIAVAGIAIANALLVWMLLRPPRVIVAPATAPTPSESAVPAPAESESAVPSPLEPAPSPGSNIGSGSDTVMLQAPPLAAGSSQVTAGSAGTSPAGSASPTGTGSQAAGSATPKPIVPSKPTVKRGGLPPRRN